MAEIFALCQAEQRLRAGVLYFRSGSNTFREVQLADKAISPIPFLWKYLRGYFQPTAK